MTEQIRKMQKEDIAQIVELIKEHHVENSHKWIDLNSNGYYWMLTSLFPNYSYVAEQRESIVGFVNAIPHGQKLYLEDILVKKIARRKKIGSELLSTLERASLENGHKEVWATVNPENKVSHNFFESNNYKNQGVQHNLKGNNEHRTLFSKQIN